MSKGIMNALVVAAILLGGCAVHGRAPDKQAPYGIQGAKIEVLPGQHRAEDILQVMAIEWAKKNGKEDLVDVINALPRPTVYWVDADPRCEPLPRGAFVFQNGRKEFNRENDCLWGLYFRWNLVFVARSNDMSNTSLAHELGGHGYRIILKGDGDADHMDTEWWKYWVGIGNSIIKLHENLEKNSKP